MSFIFLAIRGCFRLCAFFSASGRITKEFTAVSMKSNAWRLDAPEALDSGGATDDRLMQPADTVLMDVEKRKGILHPAPLHPKCRCPEG